jgi:orotate phosphoribosyltransferase-like protein
MREDIGRVKADDLEAFIKRVDELRAEGLSVQAIADRFSVSRDTVNYRIRKYRAQKKS